MRYLRKFNESRYDDVKNIIDNLKDICLDFVDNNCNYHIEPSNDIRIKVMALQGKGDVFQGINMPFYIDIDVDRRIIKQDEKRTGFGPFPEWFIETCKRIEDYMNSEGYNTLVSVRYPTDWVNLDIDELEEQTGLIQKVKLEFESLK
jgi:hypothetical protein